MSGIYYDPAARQLRRVTGVADPMWPLVSHNLEAPAHRCRRILRGLLSPGELDVLEWPGEAERLSA